MKRFKSYTSDDALGRICLYIICMMIFGFQILIFIPVNLKLPLLPFIISFRAIYLALSLFIIFVSLSKQKDIRLNLVSILLLGFWVLYAIRVVVDIGFKDLNEYAIPSQSKFYFYSYIFGSGLIPALAILISAKFIDFKRDFWLIILFSFLQTLVFIIVLSSSFDSITEEMLKYRTEIVSNKGKGGTYLNPITMGRFGAVSIISFFCIFLLFKNSQLLLKYIGGFLFVSGMFFITLGGSRGPLISAVFGLMIILFYYFGKNKIHPKLFLKWFFGILSLVIIIGYKIAPNIDYKDYAILYRIIDNTSKKKKEERNLAWESAWAQFKSAPITGDQMFDKYSRQYPHNVILESFMATGLIGGLLFTFCFMFSFFKILRLRNKIPEIQLTGAICFIFLFANFFSGGLYFNSELWAALPLMLSLKT